MVPATAPATAAATVRGAMSFEVTLTEADLARAKAIADRAIALADRKGCRDFTIRKYLDPLSVRLKTNKLENPNY